MNIVEEAIRERRARLAELQKELVLLEQALDVLSGEQLFTSPIWKENDAPALQPDPKV